MFSARQAVQYVVCLGSSKQKKNVTRKCRAEQNIYFIDVNCTVSCNNNIFINGHIRCTWPVITMPPKN